MVNYSKSVIYKIVCNTDGTLIYVGSTCSFTTRKSQHKSACYNTNNKTYNFPLYNMIRENGGWDNFRMVIIEEYPCETKLQLCIREEELRVEYNANMNGQSAYTNKKDYNKEYWKDNNEKINKKITCECGCFVVKRNMNQHLKTDKHKKLIKNNNTIV